MRKGPCRAHPPAAHPLHRHGSPQPVGMSCNATGPQRGTKNPGEMTPAKPLLPSQGKPTTTTQLKTQRKTSAGLGTSPSRTDPRALVAEENMAGLKPPTLGAGPVPVPVLGHSSPALTVEKSRMSRSSLLTVGLERG